MLTTPQLNVATGGQFNPAPLQDVPGVTTAYAGLLSRVASLPFVPPKWLETVMEEQKAQGGLWMPRYAIRADAWNQGKSEPLLADVPQWLTDPVNAIAWNKLADWWKATMQPLLSGWARDQQELLTNATENAAFWDGLYSAVKPVAAVGNAILEAPEKVADVASKVVTGTLGKLWPVLLIGAVAVVAALVLKGKLTKVTPS